VGRRCGIALQPSIASYIGANARKARGFLDETVLSIIRRIAEAPAPADTPPPAVLAELVEMHVLRVDGGLAVLDTAVFLDEDIRTLSSAATGYAREVAGLALAHGGQLRAAPPEVTCFLGGVIAIQQGLGRALEQSGFGGQWKDYTGTYARTKVDFDEVCEAQGLLSPDYQVKTVLRGQDFTAVFIGPGRQTFAALPLSSDLPDRARAYLGHLNRHLVDSYAQMLLGGTADEHPHLAAAAEMTGLLAAGRPLTSVVTAETVEHYREAIVKLTQAVSGYYLDRLAGIEELLRRTAAGRQGVGAGNQAMHLWRYIRRATAKELYSEGFLIDSVPNDGVLTIFYENGIPLVDEIL